MNEFRFPPAMQTAEEWAGVQTFVQANVEAIQRDAVMAARLEAVRKFAEEGPTRYGTFSEDLTKLLKEYQAANASNTPPEILAEYLQNCLSAFNGAQQWRQKHFEQRPKAYDFCACHYTAPTVVWGGTTFCVQCQKPVRLPSV